MGSLNFGGRFLEDKKIFRPLAAQKLKKCAGSLKLIGAVHTVKWTCQFGVGAPTWQCGLDDLAKVHLGNT